MPSLQKIVNNMLRKSGNKKLVSNVPILSLLPTLNYESVKILSDIMHTRGLKSILKKV